MSDFVSKSKGKKRIRNKKKYAVFTNILSKPETEKTVHMRLTNSEKKNEEEEKEKAS